MKKLLVLIIVLLGGIIMNNLNAEENVKASIITNKGTITLELFADKAPKTVENFVKYAEDKFYDGTVFHRVINNFMIQGGGFTVEGEHKSDTFESIQNEADNMLSNETGTIAMARTNNPHSATSQFFINVKDNEFLDHKDKKRGWGYCVFGKVIEGMDIVTTIKAVPTHVNPKNGMQDWPVDDIIIDEVKIIE
ncbi:MAG: peptidylprolyl isomerase [Candidatus Cloacimonetes bacterium]|nr:peptidylprolyl isomerase [Candidatus Cloacimonadota bacterium]